MHACMHTQMKSVSRLAQTAASAARYSVDKKEVEQKVLSVAERVEGLEQVRVL